MANAQTPVPPIYDESQVPQYDLPELLEFFSDGSKVQTAKDWEQRRKEVIQAFRDSMYGTCPESDYSTTNCEMTQTILTNDEFALDGTAIRREILLKLKSPYTGASKEWTVLLYIPKNNNKNHKNNNNENKTVPCFLGLNFAGNHAIHQDPKITMSKIVPGEEHFLGGERGGRQRKWQVEKIVQNGFALATVYSGQVEPDNHETAFRDGVHKLFRNDQYQDKHNNSNNPASWGTIAAWSWGLSRTLDLLKTVPEIDGAKVAVMGHSRKGKAALWAGAEDTRFGLVISNNSGCGGAALSRRKFGETLALMNDRFPTWLCENNRRIYNTAENDLPIDQHALISLIAPRPVYVASAVDDLWADPKGEFLSAKHAEPVYRLLGLAGFDNERVKAINTPPIDMPLHGNRATMGYHCRSGDHDVLAYDWDQYIAFATNHFHNTKM